MELNLSDRELFGTSGATTVLSLLDQYHHSHILSSLFLGQNDFTDSGIMTLCTNGLSTKVKSLIELDFGKAYIFTLILDFAERV